MRAEKDGIISENVRKVADLPSVPSGGLLVNRLQVVVYGKPASTFLKEPHYRKLAAMVCGDCGHVEPRVADPEELYEQYRQAARARH